MGLNLSCLVVLDPGTSVPGYFQTRPYDAYAVVVLRHREYNERPKNILFKVGHPDGMRNAAVCVSAYRLM